MDIGIFTDNVAGSQATVDNVVAEARRVHDAGFTSFWMPQIFGLESLTTLAIVGREVPGLNVGTDVVPTFRQHPMALAGQALTVSQAVGGRLTLGIGLSHQIVVESMWGLSYAKPARHMAEYLEALVPMLEGRPSSVNGESVTSNGTIMITAPAPTLLVAALGPRMLGLAGRLAAGTITWMVGPATLKAHIAPSIRAAAEEAGRPEPRVVASLPICVTDDPAGARERAANIYVMYGQLPAYRAMLDREGAAGPEDVALIGSADQVAERLAGAFEAGATTVVANEFGTPDERAATREALATLL